jgi:hypothetical protein
MTIYTKLLTPSAVAPEKLSGAPEKVPDGPEKLSDGSGNL